MPEIKICGYENFIFYFTDHLYLWNTNTWGAGYGASNSGANVPNVNAPNAMGGANASNDNAPGVAGGAEAIPAVQWDGAWLTANWGVVLQHLAARKQSRLVGALRMTRVIGFDGGVLKLGFDQAGEPLRVQCMGSMNQPVNAALTELAGREIRCEYVTIAGMNTPVASVSSPADAPASSAAPRLSAISTAEKGEILKDTSVRAVLDLFGGEVTDMQRTRNAEPVAEGEET